MNPRAPFIHGAILKRQADASTVTTGTRAGVEFGESREAVIGVMAGVYLDQGWTIESLVAQPMSPDMVEKIAAYHAAPPPQQMSTKGRES
jgi:hypothetical protein